MDGDQLWPAHPHPYRGELLSSWLVRVAHANGLKVQTFCRLTFGNDRQVWNRDIDRLAPAWLVETMSARTGTPLQRAWQTTLLSYRCKLFEHANIAGQLRWILPLKMYHRKRLGHGIQFCPRCLAEDAEPYFRLAWRVAFYTYCPKHDCMLLDRCPQCGQGVAYHRIELGHPDITSTAPLSNCWSCGFDYRQAEVEPIDRWSECTFQSWTKALRLVDHGAPSSTRFDYGKLAVLHQAAKLLLSGSANRRLAGYVAERTGQESQTTVVGRLAIESCDVAKRHWALGLAWWLVGRWPSRIRMAWQLHALRYNWLLRDFKAAPDWYQAFVVTLRCSTTGTGLQSHNSCIHRRIRNKCQIR
ncbi:TniQ family protein [Chitinimonas sp.]|uniref:TniQ family protein n=1 Tax=Chitinimonas sp. TaxID=1934313 RepID=UPI0035B0473B